MPSLRSFHNRYAYDTDESVGNVLRYISAPQNSRLLFLASCDLPLDPFLIEQRIRSVQIAFRNPSSVGKRIVHAILSFNPEEQMKIRERPELLYAFCLDCSWYYHCRGFLNVFSATRTAEGSIEIHIAINAVNHLNGRKLVYCDPVCLQDETFLNLYFGTYFG